MTVRSIIPFGDPILRQTAKPAGAVTPRIHKLLDDLAETLYAEEGRAGLAAPQIGILRRVIVMDCGDGLIELIDPVIVEKSGEQTGPEACLSFPGYVGQVRRANRVVVETLNREGERVKLTGEGYLARCMQHEIDHLDGVLFVDHVEERWLVHEGTKHKVSVFETIRLTWQQP